ncbi:MAG: GTP-binding protein [Candidatus Helarchaeota archaeon]
MTNANEKLKALKLIKEGLKLRDQGFFSQVIRKWQDALEIYKKLGSEMEKELADLSIEIGNCMRSIGRLSKADSYYQQAEEIYEKLQIPKELRHISIKERQEEAMPLSSSPSHKSYALKIIVVGDPSVGKSSLIRRHADNTFQENYAPTIGTDFILKVVKLEDMEITCTIWDIGGHESFMNIRNFYYEGAEGAIIVYDVTRETTFKNVKKWYNDYTKVIGIIPTLILGNKIDLDQKVKKEAGEKLAMELHAIFYETSAKTGENVNKAFGHLANLCYKS